MLFLHFQSTFGELGPNSCLVGTYYFYTAGGDPTKARKQAEADAKRVGNKTLDGAEAVGDKIDSAYDIAKSRVDSSFKSTKSTLENEYNKEKKEIGKQVEVTHPPFSPHRGVLAMLAFGILSHVAVWWRHLF
jgi:hypothetical protein